MTATRCRDKVFIAAIIFFLVPLTFVSSTERSFSALDAAKALDADITWDPLSEELLLTAGDHTVQCRVGQPLVVFDYREVAFAEALQMGQDFQLQLPAPLFEKIRTFFKQFDSSSPEVPYNAPQTGSLFQVGAILIDPGHGGKDPGTIGSYVKNGKTIQIYEKNIALTVSLSLYGMLQKRYPDKKILLTRSDDTYPTLSERIEMANGVVLKKNESILYISIHANASLSKRASGFEVWYLPPEYRRTVIDKKTASKEIAHILNSMMEEEFSTESILIAKSIVNGLDGQIGKESKNRGVKEREYFVVRNAKMPSVLIELGFVTNQEEARRLDTPSYLQKCARGIYNGLVSFISKFEQ